MAAIHVSYVSFKSQLTNSHCTVKKEALDTMNMISIWYDTNLPGFVAAHKKVNLNLGKQ